MKADLHSHTHYSDGILSPEELMQLAQSKSINVLSITDHDTFDAYLAAKHLAAKYSIDLIPGMEISCRENNKEIHVLAYAFDTSSSEMIEYTHTYKKTRQERAIQILSNLISIYDFDINIDEFIEANANTNIARPHIAKLLVSKNYASSYKDSFRFLANYSPAYVPYPEFPIEEAIKMVHRAGGVLVLAHPSNFYSKEFIINQIKKGLDGIEIIHPSNSALQSKKLKAITSQYWLLETGGSDFHGANDYEYMNIGNFTVQSSVKDSIFARANQLKKAQKSTLFI